MSVVFRTDAKSFLDDDSLAEELFGPATMFVTADNADQLEAVAHKLKGQLTATLHGTEADLEGHLGLVRILERKAGRVVFNGFPTGVEVCPSIHHGGPYPATTDSHFTSVGTAAVLRFARPVCYQNCPQPALPPQLRNVNTAGIRRTLNGTLMRDNV